MSVSELMRLEEEEREHARLVHGGRLLLVNGPPRSGKDTVGSMLKEFFPGTVYVTKMAKALKERTHALYGLVDGDGTPYAHDAYEQVKDIEQEAFLGLTPRQAYIALSERLMKPMHGDGIWGKLLVEDIQENGAGADLVVVTDSGFEREAVPVLREFGVVNSTLLLMHREGTSFEGDSRSYITLEGVNTHKVSNDGTPFQLAQGLADILRFKIPFRVEVQLPAGPLTLNWFEQGFARPSLEQALAAVEALRQSGYGTRAIRVVAGRNTVVKMVMPGDAPTTELK